MCTAISENHIDPDTPFAVVVVAAPEKSGERATTNYGATAAAAAAAAGDSTAGAASPVAEVPFTFDDNARVLHCNATALTAGVREGMTAKAATLLGALVLPLTWKQRQRAAAKAYRVVRSAVDDGSAICVAMSAGAVAIRAPLRIAPSTSVVTSTGPGASLESTRTLAPAGTVSEGATCQASKLLARQSGAAAAQALGQEFKCSTRHGVGETIALARGDALSRNPSMPPPPLPLPPLPPSSPQQQKQQQQPVQQKEQLPAEDVVISPSLVVVEERAAPPPPSSPHPTTTPLESPASSPSNSPHAAPHATAAASFVALPPWSQVDVNVLAELPPEMRDTLRADFEEAASRPYANAIASGSSRSGGGAVASAGGVGSGASCSNGAAYSAGGADTTTSSPSFRAAPSPSVGSAAVPAARASSSASPHDTLHQSSWPPSVTSPNDFPTLSQLDPSVLVALGPDLAQQVWHTAKQQGEGRAANAAAIAAATAADNAADHAARAASDSYQYVDDDTAGAAAAAETAASEVEAIAAAVGASERSLTGRVSWREPSPPLLPPHLKQGWSPERVDGQTTISSSINGSSSSSSSCSSSSSSINSSSINSSSINSSSSTNNHGQLTMVESLRLAALAAEQGVDTRGWSLALRKEAAAQVAPGFSLKRHLLTSAHCNAHHDFNQERHAELGTRGASEQLPSSFKTSSSSSSSSSSAAAKPSSSSRPLFTSKRAPAAEVPLAPAAPPEPRPPSPSDPADALLAGLVLEPWSTVKSALSAWLSSLGRNESDNNDDDVSDDVSNESPGKMGRKLLAECGLSWFAVNVLADMLRALVHNHRLDVATAALKLVRRVTTAPPVATEVECSRQNKSSSGFSSSGSGGGGGGCMGVNDGDGSGTPAEWRCCYACRHKYLWLVEQAQEAVAEALGSKGLRLHGVGLPDD